jgi:hypothetical protein
MPNRTKCILSVSEWGNGRTGAWKCVGQSWMEHRSAFEIGLQCLGRAHPLRAPHAAVRWTGDVGVCHDCGTGSTRLLVLLRLLGMQLFSKRLIVLRGEVTRGAPRIMLLRS